MSFAPLSLTAHRRPPRAGGRPRRLVMLLHGYGADGQDLLGLARAVATGSLDLAALAGLDDEAAVAALVGLDGIGRWSAEIYLLTSLHRTDILPADDLALLIGYQRLTGAAERPRASALRLRGESWRPWRSVAARLLWHYYARGPKP